MQKRFWQATVILLLFLVTNLPHFMKLQSLASGWTIPLAYTRLWCLLAFFILVILFFRNSIDWRIRRPVATPAVIGLIILLTTIVGYRQASGAKDDGAQWLKIDSPDFNRHLGLLLKSPDVGRKRLVFSYCELLDDNYAIYTDNGTKVTPTIIPNFYGPDLADNDSTLLVETIVNGQAEIWLGHFPGDSPRFQTRGESPSWQPGGNFIFIRDGRLMTQNIHEPGENTLQVSGNSRDAASAAKKNIIAFCTDQKSGNALNIFDVGLNRQKTLLRTQASLGGPCWALDDQALIFTWNVTGNRELWALRISDLKLVQLTSNPAADSSPTWDAGTSRVIFTSDRGRGLEFSALYWLPFSENYFVTSE